MGETANLRLHDQPDQAAQDQEGADQQAYGNSRRVDLRFGLLAISRRCHRPLR